MSTATVGVPIEEIIASLFEAVVYQNLATLTKGNTPAPEVLLLGGLACSIFRSRPPPAACLKTLAFARGEE